MLVAFLSEQLEYVHLVTIVCVGVVVVGIQVFVDGSNSVPDGGSQLTAISTVMISFHVTLNICSSERDSVVIEQRELYSATVKLEFSSYYVCSNSPAIDSSTE